MSLCADCWEGLKSIAISITMPSHCVITLWLSKLYLGTYMYVHAPINYEMYRVAGI